MALFNNHVHASMAQAVRANEYSLSNKSLSLKGFGLFPKWEQLFLSPASALRARPRGSDSSGASRSSRRRSRGSSRS